MTISSYDMTDAADMEIMKAKMVKAQYFTAKVTGSVDDYVEDERTARSSNLITM